MNETLFFLAIIFLLALILSGTFFLLNKKKREQTKLDYYAMFIIGVAWVVLGVLFLEAFIFAIGIIFAIWGLSRKSSWKKELASWKKEKRNELLIWALILMCVFVLLGIILYSLKLV